MMKTHHTFLAHEVPVLQIVHKGRVNVLDEVGSDVDCDESAEYMRLCRQYGEEAVERIYGPGRPGCIESVLPGLMAGFGAEQDEAEPTGFGATAPRTSRPRKKVA